MDLSVWSEIFEFLRDICIDHVRILRGSGIQVGNPNTYGEITPKFIDQIIKEVGISSNDIFWDIGSGIGNVVLQVATQVGCECHGIEIRNELDDIANNMFNKLSNILSSFNYPISPKVQFHCGDALSNNFNFSNASIIFLNNWCFGGELEHDLFVKFQQTLKHGTKIICLKDAFPRFRPNSLRWKDHPCQRFQYPWRKFKSCDDAISWDSRIVECIIYEIKDFGCTLTQANYLKNSLTITDSQSIIRNPKPRKLFIDEAKIVMKQLICERFISKDISNIKDQNILIEQMRNQRFITNIKRNNIKHSNNKSKNSNNREFKTRRKTLKNINPRIIEVLMGSKNHSSFKYFDNNTINNTINNNIIISRISIDDYKHSSEQIKSLWNENPPAPFVLKRNLKKLQKRKPKKQKLFFFQKRPFGPTTEETEFIIVKFKFPNINNIPRLKLGLYPGKTNKPLNKSKLLSYYPNLKNDLEEWFNSLESQFKSDNNYILPKSSSVPSIRNPKRKRLVNILNPNNIISPYRPSNSLIHLFHGFTLIDNKDNKNINNNKKNIIPRRSLRRRSLPLPRSAVPQPKKPNIIIFNQKNKLSPNTPRVFLRRNLTIQKRILHKRTINNGNNGNNLENSVSKLSINNSSSSTIKSRIKVPPIKKKTTNGYITVSKISKRIVKKPVRLNL